MAGMHELRVRRVEVEFGFGRARLLHTRRHEDGRPRRVHAGKRQAEARPKLLDLIGKGWIVFVNKMKTVVQVLCDSCELQRKWTRHGSLPRARIIFTQLLIYVMAGGRNRLIAPFRGQALNKMAQCASLIAP
jgi:hypothetical protein